MYLVYECEVGWLLFGDSCYFFESNKKTAKSAENDCVGKDSHLASIHSTKAMKFLGEEKIFNSNVQFVWIGGEKNGNSFQWLDGTEFGYESWDDGEPDDLSYEKCIAWKIFASSTKWHDADCGREHVYVCKKPALRKYFTFADGKDI